MTEEQENYLNDLKKLVLEYESEQQDLSAAPKELVDYFGYACLSNSLMCSYPSIPKHNAKGITEYFQTHNISTLDSLVKYIKGLKTDVDKLFAIFSWEALNIKYDVEALFSGEVKNSTLEAIFENKTAVDEGYSLFFCEMAKKVNIDQNKIGIQNYYTLSKGFWFDPLNPPSEISPDHASIYININNTPYVSEPAWAAGHLNSENQFEWNYRPDLFLTPIGKTLCDRYPCDESYSILPFKYTFEDFFKSCRVSPIGICLKTESNPLVNFESEDGYVSQIYSCVAPVNWIQIHLHKQDTDDKTVFTEIPNENITSYEIVQEAIPNHSERCRFRANIAFQEEGVYKVEVYIDSPLQVSFFVNNHGKSEIPVPLTYNPFHESRFIPIRPSRVLSKVRHGVALIRFAVSVQKSEILWNIIKLKNENNFDETDGETINRECGRYIKLKLPFDDTRYEDQLCITFPSNGRYVIQIYLSNDAGSYTSYTKYYIDVAGTEERDSNIMISPIDFLFSGRTFSATNALDNNNNQVKIVPDQACHIVNENQLDQTIQLEVASKDQQILLEFREGKDVVAVPSLIEQKDQIFTYKWTIPDKEAEYKLLCWINDNYSFTIPYIYRKEPLKEQTKEEKEILESLQQKVYLNAKYENNIKEQENNENDKKRSSKCCLLI